MIVRRSAECNRFQDQEVNNLAQKAHNSSGGCDRYSNWPAISWPLIELGGSEGHYFLWDEVIVATSQLNCGLTIPAIFDHTSELMVNAANVRI